MNRNRNQAFELSNSGAGRARSSRPRRGESRHIRFNQNSINTHIDLTSEHRIQQMSGHKSNKPVALSQGPRKPSEVLYCLFCKNYSLWDYIYSKNQYKCSESNCETTINSCLFHKLKQRPCSCPSDSPGGILLQTKEHSACVGPVDSSELDVSHSVEEKLTCAICFCILDKHNNWMCLNCETLWCSHCIHNQLAGQSDLKCPNCRCDLNYNSITSSSLASTLVNHHSRKTYQRENKTYECTVHKEDSAFFCTDCSKMICLTCLSIQGNCAMEKHSIMKVHDAPILIPELSKEIHKSFKINRVILSLLHEHHLQSFTARSITELFHNQSNIESGDQHTNASLISFKNKYESFIFSKVGYSQLRLEKSLRSHNAKCCKYFTDNDIDYKHVKHSHSELVSEFAFLKVFEIKQIQSENLITLFRKQVNSSLYLDIQIKFLPTRSPNVYDLLYCFRSKGPLSNMIPRVTLWPVLGITTKEVEEIEDHDAFYKCSRFKLHEPKYPFHQLMFSLAVFQRKDIELSESIVNKLKEKLNEEYKALYQ